MIRLHLTALTVFAVFVISTIPFVLSYETGTSTLNQPLGDFTVPSWIKNNAGWWANDQIDDDSFVSGLEWLISNDIITLPPTEQGAGDGENIIPGWIKNTAGWWAEDEIHDITFVAAIKYLIGEGIIIIEQEVQEVEELVEEVEEVKDFHMTVNSPSCTFCLNWGYIGEQYHFQIETFDEYRGDSLDGVTINAKIISKDGELRHDFGVLTTEDGVYNDYITIPNIEWYAENILSVTGEYQGIEKTIEKEFTIFNKKSSGSGCDVENPFKLTSWETMPTGITLEDKGSKLFIIGSTGDDVNEFRLSIPYCLGSATFTDSFSVSGQETSPQSLAFSTDGTKMFIVGLTEKAVAEYTLGTAWNVSTATYVDEKNVDEGTGYDKPRAVDFSSDGTKMRILWSDKDTVGEYVCTTGFDVSTCSYTHDDTSISDQEGRPNGMAFNTDGTKMFVVGFGENKVFEYTCSTGFDVSTCSVVSGGEKDISSEDTIPRGIAFNADGTKMFILGDADNDVYEYACSTGFDVSTCSYSGDGERLQIQSQTVTPLGMAFNDDGTRLFIVSNTDNDVHEYACTTGFDVSTCTVDSGDPFSVSSQDGTPRGIAFNTNGSKMFIVGKDGDDVNEYECSQFFDVSTCTVDSGDPFSVSSDDSEPSGIAFNTDGTKMFVLGANGEDVNEYVCSTGFDVSTCGSVADKDISGQEANALAMAFNSDGTKMFIGGFAGDDVNEYTLSTAYDVSTATFVDAFSILTHEGKITGLAFDTNGHRMFIVGQGGVEMNEYYLTVAWDVSTASHK